MFSNYVHCYDEAFYPSHTKIYLFTTHSGKYTFKNQLDIYIRIRPYPVLSWNTYTQFYLSIYTADENTYQWIYVELYMC